jgi:hypothetical protein
VQPPASTTAALGAATPNSIKGFKTAFDKMRGNVAITETSMGNGTIKIVTDAGSG